jgi:acyl transferase domain-containing protein/acyl carrier protein
VPQKYGYLFDPGGQDSPDGHTRAFDARAKGTVFGDGVGMVLLKRLDDALADGDTIHAVIKGSAINNDGSLKVGYTAPSVEAQAEVVALALANSGVEPSSISYIETHGSATELGDPIELAALTKAFRLSTEAAQYCAIGSVKTNVGHLDRAAGVTGLIKTVQALKHELLPPSLHYESPNPNIDFVNSPFYVNTALTPWKRNGKVRRAGVNSLGVGGTNVHVVLEEAPAQAESSESREWQLLLLSAKSESALEQMTANLCEHLKQASEAEKLTDIAYTLQVGRRGFNHRRMLVCRSREDAISTLESRDARRVLSYYQEPKSRPLTFMLSGVGDHYEGMARGLYQSEKVFKEEVDRCCELLRPVLGVDLRQLIFTANSQPQTGSSASHALNLREMLRRGEQSNTISELQQTRLAQPAVFVIEYALAQLLQHWGIRPQQLIGYSLGEYVAACLSGVFSLEDALTVVARRAALIEEVGAGAMLAVSLRETELKPLLGAGLSISIINGEKMCVVGGTVAAIEELEQRLAAQEIASRRLPTAHAFHTSMMAQVSEQFSTVLEQVQLNAPQIPMLSNVTGQLLTEAEATDPQYWVRHMCETVRFADGVAKLLKEAAGVMVEVGCGQSLSSFVKQHGKYAESEERVVISTMRHEWERVSDEEVLSTALGKLWLSGVEVTWEKYYEEEKRRRVQLPTYPFERQRYWIDSKPRASAGPKRPQSQDDLERTPKLDDWFYVPVWKQTVPLVLTESEEQEESIVWMVMTDGSSLASRLIEQLAADSATVISVGVSEQFDKIGECSYAINPGKRGDYDLLLRALEEKGQTPNRIIHLWNVASYEDASSAIELTQETLDLGFYALMFLTQALGDMGVDETRIIIVSSEMQKVTGDEDLCPAKATLLGPSIVIPCEYTNITCRGVDIVVPRPDSDQEEELVQQLVTEFHHQCKDIIVAYRGEKRWEQTFDPLPLVPLTTPSTAPPPRIRTNGTYLITGGVGGIGLAIAEHLARTAQANLVLISRSGLPERDRWQQLVADEQTPSSLAQKIAQVQALEEMGAEVLVLSADVGDMEQMREAVRRAEERFGPVDGVIHAAGVPGAGLIQLKTEDVAASVLRPKVQGTLVLDEIFKDLSLDFLLLFSSMTSIVGGGPGQLDYCAANAFLDAFAQKNNSRQRPVFAINWGEWQWDAWQEGLLGFDAKIAAVFKENRRRFGVSFEEGLDAIGRVLATRLPQVVVSTRDFKWLIELSKEFTVSGILSEADKKGAPGQAYPRPALGTSYVTPSTEVEHTIAAIWQELLRIEQVGINDNFFELGGNSLLGITLVGQMKKRLKVEMPMYALYEAPTVSAMSKFINKDNKEDQSLDERRDRGEMRRKRQQQRRTDTRGELAIR